MSQINHNVRLLNLEGNAKRKNTQNDRTTVRWATDSTHTPRLISTDYDPQTGTYQTNRFDACNNRPQINTTDPCQPQTSQKRMGDDSLRYYLRNVLSSTTTASSTATTFKWFEYLISYLFYLNVFMSILNTLLLSFLVKSLQMNGTQTILSREGTRLVWDEHSESIILDLPVSLRGDKFLSVGTIESNQDRPLIIEHFNGKANRLATIQTAGDQFQPLNVNKNKMGGQILISAQSKLLSESRTPNEANYILLPNELSHLPGERGHKRRRRPVEIVTNSLILNQLNDGEHLSTQKDAPRNADSRSHSYGVHAPTTAATNTRNDQAKRQNNMQTMIQANSRRLLELDGANQTIVLPLLNKIDLFPLSSKTLFVNDELRCNSAINGRLDDHFDVQTRWGNLSFQSGRTLRIVSKSAKLDLASTRLLSLEAPTLRFNVPQTNKVFVSNGIKFFDLDQEKQSLTEKDDEQLSGQYLDSNQNLSSPSLEAFKLVLVGDILMAAPD